MYALDLQARSRSPLRVVCIGAHSDDIEIGCGGLILSLLEQRAVDVDWWVFSASGAREREARRSARMFLANARRANVAVHPFRDGFFPYDGAQIKDQFEALKKRLAGPPDLILTHYRDDRHQDHRVLSDLTWNTFRDHWVLEYEIPKFDGDLGHPNCFVAIDKTTARRKVRALNRAFGSQRDKHWFSDETFLGLMRLRGMECRSATGYAEAFYSRKTLVRV
jgi:LmbE family N-acetylglucosaminyl deacetylase